MECIITKEILAKILNLLIYLTLSLSPSFSLHLSVFMYFDFNNLYRFL